MKLSPQSIMASLAASLLVLLGTAAGARGQLAAGIPELGCERLSNCWRGLAVVGVLLLLFLSALALMRYVRGLAVANRNMHAQRRELELAAQVFEQSPQSIVITDRSGTILRVNPYFCELTGYLPEEAVGRTPRMLKSQRHDGEFYRELWQSLLDEGKWRGEIWNRKKNGDGFAALLTISSVRNPEGEITHFIGVIEDITQQKLSSEHIFHLAHFDVLTNLPNRRLFNDRLEVAIQQAERRQHSFAVLFLDLDAFKVINDTLGHRAGDLVLQAVAQRLHACLRKVDAIARLGGDEFAVLLDEVSAPSDIRWVGSKIIEAVAAPIELDGVEAQIGVSIGVSIYPADGGSAAELLGNADTAMYRAKSMGKNHCQFFGPEMDVKANHRHSPESGF